MKTKSANDIIPSGWDGVHSKIAEVTLAFWVLKIIGTTLGETAGDFLSMTLGLGYYASFAMTAAVLVALVVAQVRSASHNPMLFWSTVVATTTAGTEISDMMDRSFGLGYAAGSAILTAGLLLSLAVWYSREKNLRIHPMTRPGVEILFWTAVTFSNSLGTAFGDFLTDNLSLSYVQGAIATALVIGIVVLLHYWSRVSDVLLFWVAFVFTRPFGATFGDFLTKPHDHGGLALPREMASLVALSLMLAVLATVTGREIYKLRAQLKAVNVPGEAIAVR